MANKVLMLNLEETIISNQLDTPAKRIFSRPYAEIFLGRTKGLFDERYLNTSVPEEEAMSILHGHFSSELVGDFKYWNFHKYSDTNKADGYLEFEGSKLVHVEDTLFPGDEGYLPHMTDEEKKCRKFGVFFLPIRKYEPDRKWFFDRIPRMPKNDKELARILKVIERNIRHLTAVRRTPLPHRMGRRVSY